MTHSHVDSLNTEWLQWLIAVRGITVSCEDVVIVLWLLQDITKLLQKCKEEVSIRLALCKLQVSDCQSLISTLQAMSCKSSVWTQVSDVSLCLCVNAVCVCVCVCVCRSARCHRWSKRYVLHLIDAVMKSLNTERRVTAVMKSLNTERRVTAVMKSLNTEWLLWWSLWTLNDCCDEVFEHWASCDCCDGVFEHWASCDCCDGVFEHWASCDCQNCLMLDCVAQLSWASMLLSQSALISETRSCAQS